MDHYWSAWDSTSTLDSEETINLNRWCCADPNCSRASCLQILCSLGEIDELLDEIKKVQEKNYLLLSNCMLELVRNMLKVIVDFHIKK